MALAPSALSNLDAALNLFNQVSTNPGAIKVLVSANSSHASKSA